MRRRAGFRSGHPRGPAPGHVRPRRLRPPSPRGVRAAGFRSGTEGRAACKVKAAARRRGGRAAAGSCAHFPGSPRSRPPAPRRGAAEIKGGAPGPPPAPGADQSAPAGRLPRGCRARRPWEDASSALSLKSVLSPTPQGGGWARRGSSAPGSAPIAAGGPGAWGLGPGVSSVSQTFELPEIMIAAAVY